MLFLCTQTRSPTCLSLFFTPFPHITLTMRSFTLLTTALVVASNVFAAPSGAGQGYCLCEKEAMAVADNVQHFFSNYSDEFARKVFTKNIQDQTDSVQFLMNNGTTCPAPVRRGASMRFRIDARSSLT